MCANKQAKVPHTLSAGCVWSLARSIDGVVDVFDSFLPGGLLGIAHFGYNVLGDVLIGINHSIRYAAGRCVCADRTEHCALDVRRCLWNSIVICSFEYGCRSTHHMLGPTTQMAIGRVECLSHLESCYASHGWGFPLSASYFRGVVKGKERCYTMAKWQWKWELSTFANLAIYGIAVIFFLGFCSFLCSY